MNLPDLVGKVVINNSQAKTALAEIGKEANTSLAAGLAGGASTAAKALGLVAAGAGLAALQLKSMAENGRTVSQVTEAFKSLAAAQKQNYEVMLNEGRKATRGLVSDFELMAAGNKAMLLGLPITAREMGILSGASVTLGQAMNQGPTKSLNDLITGLSRGSAQILDNLGIVVKAKAAHEAYGTSIGKAAKDLTEAEKKTAVYNAAIKAMSENVEKLGGVQLSLASRMEQVGVMWTNLTNAADVAVAQSPALNAAMGSIAEGIEEAYGPGQQGMVAAMTDYMNRFGLGSIQVAEWAVTAYQSIKLGLINLAYVLVATNPLTMFNKGMKDSLKQMEADTKASFTSQMNTLSAFNEKVKKSIEDSHANQNKAAGNALAGALGGGGGGATGGGKGGEKSFLQKFVDEMREIPRTANEIARAVRESWEDGLNRAGYAPKIATEFGGVTNVNGKGANIPLETPGIAQWIGDHVEESWKNAPLTPDEIKLLNAEQEKARETAARWAGALQGVALMAGAIGGKLGETINVIGNIGKSFEGWDKLTKTGRFNAIAGGVGQIGGLVGGTAGRGIQGGAGGAMLGSALSSALKIAGPWGAIAGGAIGFISGLFGGGKQKEAERKEREAQKLIDEQNRAAEAKEKRISGVANFSGGMNQYYSGGISDQGSADRAGRFAMFSFGQQVKESGDIFGALDSIGPTLAKMAESAEKFGLEMPAGVQSLLQLNGLDDSIKSQVSGLNMMTKGIGESGMMSKSLFTDLGAEAVATRAKLEETGLSGAQSMALMQPSLQQLYEMQKLHGYAVDDTTQALLDEAKAQGVVGDQFMSANERMVELLGILIETIGGQLPESYKRAGDAAEEYGRRASNSLPRGPNGPYQNPPPIDDPPDDKGFSSGTAFRNFGAGQLRMLHGEEAVMTRPQVDRLVGMAVAGAPVSSAAGGGSRDVSAPIMLTAKIVLPDGRVVATVLTDVMRADGVEAHDLRRAISGAR